MRPARRLTSMRAVLGVLLTAALAAGCGGGSGTKTVVETQPPVTVTATAGTTETADTATTTAASSGAVGRYEFDVSTPRGYSYHLSVAARPRTFTTRLGDPGKISLELANSDFATVTVANTTSSREAPMSGRNPAPLEVLLYKQVPAPLLASAGCDSAESPCYTLTKDILTLPTGTLAIGASVDLQQVPQGGPWLFGQMPESTESQWRAVLSARPDYVVVEVDPTAAPFGNNAISDVGGWTDFTCPEQAEIGVFGPDGEVAGTESCSLGERLYSSRAHFAL
jgi:hypothetical protein